MISTKTLACRIFFMAPRSAGRIGVRFAAYGLDGSQRNLLPLRVLPLAIYPYWLEASKADEVLAILETHWPITAIFSDIDMPGSMDGLELARLVRDRWPPVHIILTSARKKLRAEQLPDRARFLPKPYLHETVIGSLKSLID